MAKFKLFEGTNGTGKTTQMKKFLKANKRNLIIPANRFDTAWHGIPELTFKQTWLTDPDDYAQKRKVRKQYVEGLNTFTGTRVLYIDDPEQFKYIVSTRHGFRNGGIFIDDYKNHIKSAGILPSHVRQMLGDRRHREIDIFMASHSLQDINAEFMQFQPDIYIFYCTRPPSKSVFEKVPDPNLLQEAYEHVKRENEALPQNQRHYFIEFKATSL